MNDVSLFDLLIRLTLSLGIVALVLWVAARVVNGRSNRPRALKRRSSIEVVAQHRLGRRASVAVIQAAGRSLVVGVTDQQITLLGEADPELVEQAAAATAETAADDPHTSGANGRVPSRGDTDRPIPAWRAALEDLRERTVRRA